MSKFLIGVGTAAVWFALSHAANAERVCKQVCDSGTCVSRCVDSPDTGVIVHEHDDYYRDHRDGPGIDFHAPGVDVDVGH
jgi:hypothetical protein